MVNPKSLLNLKHFKPGNPGRPEGSVSLTSALKRYAKEHPDELDSLAADMFKEAHTNPAYAREIAERLDGKVPQALTGPNNGPLEILVRWDGNRNLPNSTPA